MNSEYRQDVAEATLWAAERLVGLTKTRDLDLWHVDLARARIRTKAVQIVAETFWPLTLNDPTDH